MNMKENNQEMNRFIRLQDGRLIEGYPKGNVSDMDGEAKEFPTFDTTGVYFSIGKKPKKPQPIGLEEEELQNLFTDNAFLILANRERILNDSRMLLAPVAVRNGLAYTGAFQTATLGVYLEWWMNTPYSVLFDEQDTMSLIYFLSGSALSGSNRCAKVYEDGRTEEDRVPFFDKLWPKFADILGDYYEPKKRFEAYSLPEVIDILKQETTADDYAKSIEEFHKQAKIALLEARLQNLEREYKTMTEKRDYYQGQWHRTLIQSRPEKVKDFYNGYLEKEKIKQVEIAKLKKERNDLDERWQKGELTHKQYRKMMRQNEEAVNDAWGAFLDFKTDLAALFPEITVPRDHQMEVNSTEESILDRIIELFQQEKKMPSWMNATVCTSVANEGNRNV